MATLEEIESMEGKAGAAGTVDLVIGIAGPVGDADLRSRALEVLPGLFEQLSSTGTAFRIAVASAATSVAETSTPFAGESSALQFVSYPFSAAAIPVLPLLAVPATYRAIAKVAESMSAQACIIVAQDLGALDGASIAALAKPLIQSSAQLTMPVYPTGKYEGLLNSAILYPLTRALYGRQVRYPIAVDFGIGGAMIARLAAEQGRNQSQPMLWPGIECALGDATLAQAYVTTNHSAQNEGLDLNTVLGRLAGGLFEDVEKNPAMWQRVRGSQTIQTAGAPTTPLTDGEEVDVRPLVESFQLALRNLQDVWGLVLPPVTLLELKKIARLAPEEFHIPDALWARIIYDFALAHRLRTISRTHLLGALTPLYLGWVASYASQVRGGDAVAAERRIEQLAAVYEECKPYFVSRWRWPDRFNP